MSTSITITVVEDNIADVMFLEDALSHADVDFDLRVIKDGGEARKVIAQSQSEDQNSPDLILLDLNVPRVNGITLLREIRQSSAFQTTPVILWSSTCSPRDIEAAQQLGIDAIVEKPGTLQSWWKLGERLKKVVSSRPR